MPTLFLSHTSIDKPFVEKLACDLDRLGIDSWYDKYEIKVGESIFWKVEEELRIHELKRGRHERYGQLGGHSHLRTLWL